MQPQATQQGAQQAPQPSQEPSQAAQPVDLTQYPPESLASFQGHANDVRLSPGGVIELTPGAHNVLSRVSKYLKKPFSYRNPGTTPIIQSNFFGWAGKSGTDSVGRPAGWAGIVQLTQEPSQENLPVYIAWAEQDAEGFIRRILQQAGIGQGQEVLVPMLAKLFKQWAQQHKAARKSQAQASA